jgi:hypothetical protein
LKCGAEERQDKAVVVVCKDIPETEPVTLLKVQQYRQVIHLHYVPLDQIVADQSKVIMLAVTLMLWEHHQD